MRTNRLLCVILGLFLALLCANRSIAQTSLINGGYTDGTVVVNGTNTYTFTASKGDSILLTCVVLSGDVNFNPRMRLYGTNGVYLTETSSYSEGRIAYQPTNSGTFTILVGSGNAGLAGSYRLRLTQIPGSYVTLPGDESGSLTNGGLQDAVIEEGDQDFWTFSATKGDNILLTCVALGGDVNFNPWVRLYGTNGVYLTQESSYTEGRIAYQPTNSGTFTILVGSGNAGLAGTYRLRLTQIPGAYVTLPGDESGSLTNGGYQDGTNNVGDQDFWTFTANKGDNILLTCVALGGDVNFNPWVRLYGTNGVYLTQESSYSEGRIAYQPTNSGTFTILVGSGNAGLAGTYRLRLTQVPGAYVTLPGDETGALTNGGLQDALIEEGDQDFWTFTATKGDNILLTCVALGGDVNFNPWMRLYGTNGVYLTQESSYTEGRIAFQPTNSGTFTILVGSGNAGLTGTYRLRLTQIPGAYVTLPGDETGALTNGGLQDAVIEEGDQDFWTFTATKGDNVLLSCVALSGDVNFNPWMRLYGTNGVYLAQESSYSEGRIAYVPTNSGTFTLLVGSANAGLTGTYRLRLTQVPGPFVVTTVDEGGSLTNGANHNGVIDVGDQDIWKFTACKGDNILLHCVNLGGDVNFNPWIRLYGPTGAFLTQAASYSDAVVNYTATNSGAFTILVGSGNAGLTGSYRLTGDGLSDGLKLCDPIISAPNVVLSGVGGVSNAVFQLHTTTNITTPAALWTPILTNQFDQYGVFHFTNQFNRAERERYFRLLQQ